ncbi:hypothetical protein LCGC14_0497790 [marine sediment metagenome]|uniref:RiPP n=1 Tax=marine sediment metagenome TaxID=412755 RepID=A0A0F9SA08_9ZZZZ
MKKGAYSAPQLVSHGKLEALTHASTTTTTRTDAAFPAGSNPADFTFT